MAVRFSIEIRGLGEALAGFDRMPAVVVEELGKGILDGAQMIAQDAARSITSGGRSGEIRRGHQASAPGEPPASITGELAGSIQAMKGLRGISARIVSTHPAALIFEFGSRRIQARPFLRPAVDRMAPRVEQRMNQAAAAAADKLKG